MVRADVLAIVSTLCVASASTVGVGGTLRLTRGARDDVCSGRITLRRAQRLIARDWVAAYHARFS
jgi:hypothetical protein